MKSGVNSRLAATGVNLPADLFKQRLAITIGCARSQKRESWWYSPWSDALNYLCLATSTGVEGSGVGDTERGRGASFYLCPQKELVRDVPRPQSMPCLYTDTWAVSAPLITTVSQVVLESPHWTNRVCSPLLGNPNPHCLSRRYTSVGRQD